MDTLLQMKTLSVVPLADNQAVTQSQIFFGDIQSIYMSQKSLYIASSVYEPSITSKCPPNARCAMPMIWN
jgi:hypothetical protein